MLPLEVRIANRICQLKAKMCANWIINDLLGHLKREGIEIEDSPITPKQIADLVDLMDIKKEIIEIVLEELRRK